jgi:hypothetical protein
VWARAYPPIRNFNKFLEGGGTTARVKMNRLKKPFCRVGREGTRLEVADLPSITLERMEVSPHLGTTEGLSTRWKTVFGRQASIPRHKIRAFCFCFWWYSELNSGPHAC